jgi:acetyl-CoA acyltransferase
MGIGPVPAVRKLLVKPGLTVAALDRFEVNEAFASQAPYCLRELGLPVDRLNVNGGVIALGHPLEATNERAQSCFAANTRALTGDYSTSPGCDRW